MIKTESGEKIEPRVGDVVLGEDGEIERITKKNIDAGFIQRYCLVTEQDYCLLYKNCTLLHRPFQVGDEVTIYEVDEDLIVIDELETVLDDEWLKASRVWFEFEHKQESWRDHSEWRKDDE